MMRKTLVLSVVLALSVGLAMGYSSFMELPPDYVPTWIDRDPLPPDPPTLALTYYTDETEFDAATSGFLLSRLAYEDPYGKWHSSQDRKGGNNRAGYKNQKADEILDRVQSEFDVEKRYALLQELHALIHEDQPFTFLYSMPSLVAVNKRWRNVIIHKCGLDFYVWWLPLELISASDEIPDE